jgi:hypothetical protein
MPIVNFRPHRSILETERPDAILADPTILVPGKTTSLLDGEWLELDSADGYPKYKRGTAAQEGTTFLTGPFWGEQGRTDIQFARKLPIIISGNLEASTRICDKTGLTVSGTPLVVKDVTVDARTCRGLAKATGNGQHTIVALYVGPGQIIGDSAASAIRVWIKSPFQVTI